MIEGVVEVQGTVKVDQSDELKNLYVLARRAKNNQENETAAKYYDMILVKEPKSWEGKLDRMVARLQSDGVESTPYEDRVW